MNRRTRRWGVLCAGLLSLGVFGCTKSRTAELNLPPPRVVESVDLERYAGKWYEIARLPNRFQNGCSETTATYTLEEGERLKVTFLWPFSGDYWIVDLAADYSYAVVGTPSRDFLWILSRSANMPDDTYRLIVDKMKDEGFDVARLEKTEHTPG